MCGIGGIITFENIAEHHKYFRESFDLITHRGPDESGAFVDNNLLFLHKRLSIIGLEDGHQPICNENYTLICNGEIYNYKDIKQKYCGDYKFQTSSDNEVIIPLIKKYGVEGIQFLQGMFSFALYDHAKHTILIVRDRLGIKPLHYYCDDSKFLFASEVKVIALSKIVKKELNYEALADYLQFKFVLGGKTFFNNIHTLEPGCYLEYSLEDKTHQIKQYWDIQYNPVDYSHDEALTKFEELFSKTVELHLTSDVEVASLLSGGLDSTAIVMESTDKLQNLKTFTCAYKNRKDQDLKYASIVAKHFNNEKHVFYNTPDKFGAFMKQAIWYLDEPGGGSTAIHGYYICHDASDYVKVLLTGEGADEILGGYEYYLLDYLAKQSFMEQLKYLTTKNPHRLRNKIRNLFTIYKNDLKHSDVDEYYKKYRFSFTEQQQQQLLTSKAVENIKSYSPHQTLKDIASRFTGDSVRNLMYIDIKAYLYRILHIYDRMTMASSLENRVPFMDHKLVEFAFTLPTDVLFHNYQTKSLIRSYLESKLGKEHPVVTRKKAGFTLPVGDWFKGSLKEMVETELHSLSRRPMFNKKGIDDIWRKFLKGQLSVERIWSLLSLEYFMQNFFDEP